MKTYTNMPPRTGFTLIELMVSVTILTIITGIVYQCFSSVVDSAEVARVNAEELRFRQYLQREITTALISVYSDAGCTQDEYQFLGSNEDGAYGPADSMRFCTSLPMSGAAALPGVLRTVTLSLADSASMDAATTGRLAIDRPDGAQDNGMVLVVHEEPLALEDVSGDLSADGTDNFLDKNTTNGVARKTANSSSSSMFSRSVASKSSTSSKSSSKGKKSVKDLSKDSDTDKDQVFERAIPVRSINIEYYNAEEDKWEDDWDSTAVGRLPWAVHITINFVKTEAELQGDAADGLDPTESPDLDMIVTLPPGLGTSSQYFDPNHMRGNPMGLMNGGEAAALGNTNNTTNNTNNKQNPRSNSSTTGF